MTDNPTEDKGYEGQAAADMDRPADERDVQTAPSSDVEAQNVEQPDEDGQASETEQQ